MNSFVSALIGGIVTALIYPFVKYWGIRRLNTCRVKVDVDSERSDFLYIRVKNSSFVTLKSVMGFITVDNTPNDIVSGTLGFCSTQIFHDLLSWAKVIDGKNKGEIDLNQGQMQRLNVLAIQNKGDYIQISSEQGYNDVEKETTGRAILYSKGYLFDIVITADNISPISLKIRYDPINRKLSLAH